MSSLLFLDVYVCSVEARVIDVVGQGRGAMAVTTIAASGICVEVEVSFSLNLCRARKDLAKIFTTIIRNRKVSGKLQPDMLQAFIDSKYRSLGRSTTEEECTGLLIAALFAGQHTSSITSTWTGAYLMRWALLSTTVFTVL